MLAASVHSALGRAGLLIMLAASVCRHLHRAHRPPPSTGEPVAARAAIRMAGVRGCRTVRRRHAAGPDHPGLLAGVRPAGRLDRHPAALQLLLRCGSSLEGSILLWSFTPRRFHGRRRVALPQEDRRRTRGVGAARDVRHHRVLRVSCPSARRTRSPSVLPVSPTGGSEPVAPEPRPRAVPPADPLSRLRRFHGAVRLRDRRADHRAAGRGVAPGDQTLGPVQLGLPDDRHPARWLVELRGARMVGGVGRGIPWRTRPCCRG